MQRIPVYLDRSLDSTFSELKKQYEGGPVPSKVLDLYGMRDGHNTDDGFVVDEFPRNPSAIEEDRPEGMHRVSRTD